MGMELFRDRLIVKGMAPLTSPIPSFFFSNYIYSSNLKLNFHFNNIQSSNFKLNFHNLQRYKSFSLKNYLGPKRYPSNGSKQLTRTNGSFTIYIYIYIYNFLLNKYLNSSSATTLKIVNSCTEGGGGCWVNFINTFVF